jgi:hypothetical protein
VISGFRHNVDEICALVGYYAALRGTSVPTLRENIWVISSRVKKSKEKVFLEDGSDRLFPKVDTELPLYSA